MRFTLCTLGATVLLATLTACAGSTPAVGRATTPDASERRELRGTMSVSGPLTYSEVAEAIAVAHSREEVLACYESGAEWIDVKFAVDVRGAARDVEVSGPLFASDRSKSCLENLVRATRYPKAAREGATEVKWSLTYAAVPRGMGLMRGRSDGLGLTRCPKEPCEANTANDNPVRTSSMH